MLSSAQNSYKKVIETYAEAKWAFTVSGSLSLLNQNQNILPSCANIYELHLLLTV